MAQGGPLSYSSVSTYLECPLRWKFLYVDRLPETPRGYFSFGRTVHSVLEEMLKPFVLAAGGRPGAYDRQRRIEEWGTTVPDGPPALLSPAELLAMYEKLWVSDGYTSPEEEARYRSLGANLLLRYRESLAEAPPTPVAVEAHLEATWDGIPVHGYLDRIDRTPTGGLEVLDYKTSRELSRQDAAASDQLSLYQVLVEKNYSEPVEGLTLYHLRSNSPFRVPPRGRSDLDRLYDRLGNASDGIRSQTFEPTPGRHCSRCEFQNRCPEFRDVPGPDRERLAALVDRFATLRNEERKLDGELRQAAEALHREAERLGVHRIPGGSSTVVRRREESVALPPEGVGAILDAAGLTGRIDPTDPAQLRKLLRDPSIDPATRRRLEGAGARTVRWFWTLENGGESGAAK